MAGGRTSSWADAVATTLDRLDVAETIEELRHHIDELISRLADRGDDEDRTEQRSGEDEDGQLNGHIDDLGRKVEAASDLLAELADVLEAQTERIETIEQQLGDPDRRGAFQDSPQNQQKAAEETPSVPDVSLATAIVDLRDMLDVRLGAIEGRFGGLEHRLDDMLVLAGERERQIRELEERLLILVDVGERGNKESYTSLDGTAKVQPRGDTCELTESAVGVSVSPVGMEMGSVTPADGVQTTTLGKWPARGAAQAIEASAEMLGRSSGRRLPEPPGTRVLPAASEGSVGTFAHAADSVPVTPSVGRTEPGGKEETVAQASGAGNGQGLDRIERLVERAVAATRDFAPGAGKTEFAGGGKSHPTVLVVDDVPDARMILSVYLSKTGYQVVTATSAEDCLAKLRHHDVDAIVLDARMPGADGRHVCQILSRDPAFADKRGTPVIVYTGYPDQYSREEVISWGATDYVVKGGDMLPLITALVRHTQRFAEAGL